MPKKQAGDAKTSQPVEEMEKEKQLSKTAAAKKSKKSSTAKSAGKSSTAKSTGKSRTTKSKQKSTSRSASKTTVAQVMTDTVHRVDKMASLNEAARCMWENDVGMVPVVDPDGGLAGIVTDRDVAMAAYLKGRALRDIGVQEVMSTNIESMRPNDAVDRACSTMAQHQIRRLPVVDDDGMLMGVLSINDLALASGDSSMEGITEHDVAETLRAICVRRGAEEGRGAMPVTS